MSTDMHKSSKLCPTYHNAQHILINHPETSETSFMLIQAHVAACSCWKTATRISNIRRGTPYHTWWLCRPNHSRNSTSGSCGAWSNLLWGEMVACCEACGTRHEGVRSNWQDSHTKRVAALQYLPSASAHTHVADKTTACVSCTLDVGESLSKG